MANSVKHQKAEEFFEPVFLSELYKKTKPLPHNAENGNQCVCIDMSNCSQVFLRKVEQFIADNPDHFRLVARGLDYYLEVLGREDFTTAYQKSLSRH